MAGGEVRSLLSRSEGLQGRIGEFLVPVESVERVHAVRPGGIEEEHVVHSLVAPRLCRPSPVAPNHFILEASGAKDTVQKDLEVVARRRVTVKIKAAAPLKDAAQLHETGRHHCEIRHDIRLTKDGSERSDSAPDRPPE